MNHISILIQNLLLSISLIVVWHFLLNKKINFKNYKIYFAIISIDLVTTIFCILNLKLIKIIFLLFIFGFFIRFIFKEKISICIGLSVFYEFIIVLSETLYAIFLFFILQLTATTAINDYSNIFITNIMISVISIFLSKLKVVQKIFTYFVSLIEKLKKTKVILICLFMFFSIISFTFAVYYEFSMNYIIIIYFITMITIFSIVIYLFYTQNKYIKVSDKYNVAVDSLKNYEEMIKQNRIDNHENKNLLLTIREMIKSKEKNIDKYIDKVVQNKFKDDEIMLKQTAIIPSGGLRATIYAGLLKMKNKNIKSIINIDKNISTLNFINLDNDCIIDICKILGVFIDNAIDAVNDSQNKEIYLDLTMSKNCLNISISNIFSDKIIDPNKLFEPGYTTKGKGHGYGLPMVKKIIELNNNLDNIVEINKNIISHKLIIKTKKDCN